MSVRIVLGTANFGTNYGLRGTARPAPNVNFDIASAIISAAAEIGITEIDTALAYGPSQKWISELIKHRNFQVNSKIIWGGAANHQKYQSDLKQIVSELGSSNLHLLQWHNWEKGSSTKEDYAHLHSLLDPGMTLDIGVTTYGSDTVKDALFVDSFESIQLEFNILNQAPLKTFLGSCGTSRPQLYLRSLLLQGLLSDNLALVESRSLILQEKIREIQLLAQEWNLSTQELALRAALTFVEDCALVVGVESGEQLLEIAGFVENGPLSPELAKVIDALDSGYDPEVDPRNWVF